MFPTRLRCQIIAVRRLSRLLALGAIAIALSVGPAFSQDSRDTLNIERFEPEHLQIEAGHEAFVLLHGRALHEATEARIIKGGTDAVGIVGTLATAESASATVRVLRITTSTETPPGRYRAQLRVGRGIVATMARFDLTVTEPNLAPAILDALFDETATQNKSIRIRVRTSSVAPLAHVLATMGSQVVEAKPLARDPRIAEVEFTTTEVGQQTIELIAVDTAERRSEPVVRTIEIREAIADLTIRSIELKPATPHAGQSVGAFVTIANTGTADVNLGSSSVLLTWNVDGKAGREFAIGRETLIEAGHERVYGPLIFEVEQAGSHPVEVTLDPMNLVTERDKANNTLVEHLAVGPRQHPDLTITGVEFDPPRPSANSPFRVQVRIMNQGSATATIFPPDLIVKADGFRELRAGPQAMVLPPARITLVTLHPLPESSVAGAHRWTFHIDPDNRVAESVEDNNSYLGGITLGTDQVALPDLVVESAAIRPEAPKTGDAMFIVLGIKNVGTTDAVIPAGHMFYELAGPMGRVIPILTQTVERIAPGKVRGMRTVDFAIATPGTHSISIQLDPQRAINEVTEANNVKNIPVTVN
jgi:hypothetical protein